MNTFYATWLANHLSEDEIARLDGLPDATILALYPDLLAAGPNTREVQYAYQRFMTAASTDEQELLILVRPIILTLELHFDAALSYRSWLRRSVNPTEGSETEQEILMGIGTTVNGYASEVAEAWKRCTLPELKSHINRAHLSRKEGVGNTLLWIANQKDDLVQPIPQGMNPRHHISWQESADVVMQGFQ